ncbi:MAG: phosphoenolpyruvate synthase [Candidatus Woykebacteria bacterium]
MKYVVNFSQVGKEDISLVGAKAANLGELSKIRISVPTAYILTSQAYFEFLNQNKLEKEISNRLKRVNYEDTHLLNKISSDIKNLILGAELPAEIIEEIRQTHKKISIKNPFVAVRSSATAEDLPQASFAGQYQSFLNVKGEKDLIFAIRKCWASLFEPRAIFYREEKSFNHLKVGIAVIIQEMIEPEASGVMFTVNPVTNNKSRIVIESVWGLGELVVKGEVTPDHYEVEKGKFVIIDKKISLQKDQLVLVEDKNRKIQVSNKYAGSQKISDVKILELAKIGKKIENLYLLPQDIEWAYSDKLYILQSRPVTTFSPGRQTSVKTLDIKLPILLKGTAVSPGISQGVARVIKNQKDLEKIKRGEILVVRSTQPNLLPAMKKACAIITEQGDSTSHASIVSRELGKPCVVSALGATDIVKPGSALTINGTSGIVYKGSLPVSKMSLLLSTYEEKSTEGAPKDYESLKTATKILLNLSEVNLAAEASSLNVDGVGLLRAEFIVSEIGVHPQKLIDEKKEKDFIESLAEGLKIFGASFEPRPVIYRAVDFRSSEYKSLGGGEDYEPDEPNPFLGHRGASRYISNPKVFELELSAIKIARNKFNLKNLWISLPFVRTLKEMEEVKKIISASGLHRSPSFKLLMIVEIPSNVVLIDKFLDLGLDGVIIDLNDLTMLMLGMDKHNSFSGGYLETDQSVMWSLERVIKECRQRGLYSGVYGHGPTIYPNLAEKLVEWGVTSISVSLDLVEKTREIIYEAEKKLVAARSHS